MHSFASLESKQTQGEANNVQRGQVVKEILLLHLVSVLDGIVLFDFSFK